MKHLVDAPSTEQVAILDKPLGFVFEGPDASDMPWTLLVRSDDDPYAQHSLSVHLCTTTTNAPLPVAKRTASATRMQSLTI